MAGVPSIVYGFFGLVLIVPLIRQTFRRNRDQYAGSLCFTWNDDPSDHHRSYRICDPQRT